MIIYNYDKLEDFLNVLSRRIGSEVFAHFSEEKSSGEDSQPNHILILQFLGRVDPAFLNLHQCILRFNKNDEKDKIIQNLLTAFKVAGNIQLIPGKIQELVMSLA